MAWPEPELTSGFTDMQWYMYHQRNVAFFGAFTSRALSDTELSDIARALTELAPQLRAGLPRNESRGPIPPMALSRIIYKETVASLAGFPDTWFESGARMFEEPGVPLFRLRYAEVSRPAADGRCGFLLVQVAHALVEGMDSALLSRSRSAQHLAPRENVRAPLAVRVAAGALGSLLAPLHLMAAQARDLHPGPYAFASRAFERAALGQAARAMGVRQRSLYYCLAMATLFPLDADRSGRRISATYSAVDPRSAGQDGFMRMRMLFANFETRLALGDFARVADKELASAEARESGFNAELNARGVRAHRRLSRIAPFAYGPKLFRFMPFDVVLGLIPPHRLAGPLTQSLMEPVYAGAALEGVNACVMVPGKTLVTFNFYIQSKLLPLIPELDRLVATLSPGSSLQR